MKCSAVYVDMWFSEVVGDISFVSSTGDLGIRIVRWTWSSETGAGSRRGYGVGHEWSGNWTYT